MRWGEILKGIFEKARKREDNPTPETGFMEAPVVWEDDLPQDSWGDHPPIFNTDFDSDGREWRFWDDDRLEDDDR